MSFGSSIDLKTQVINCVKNDKCDDLQMASKGSFAHFVRDVLNTLGQGGAIKDVEAVEHLSKALEQINFSPEWQRLDQSAQAIVGVPYGLSFWRELCYLLLGRSYYALKNYQFAEERFAGIPSSSPFYDLASIHLFWSYVAQNKTKELVLLFNKIEQSSFRQSNPDEFQLFLSIVGLQQHATAADKRVLYLEGLKSVAYRGAANPVNRMLAFNLYATHGFKYWHQNYTSMDDSTREKLLLDILDAASQISRKNCNEECQYFTAEAQWNLATHYRLIDPDKNSKKIRDALDKAEKIIAGSMEQAVKNSSTNLREDAYFLGVVIAWERTDFKAAITRSNAYERIFPVGRYREDVFQMLADYYFEQKDFTRALASYQDLVKLGDLEKSTYGMFKASWCFYNLDQKWPALRHMERIVQAAAHNQSKDEYHIGVLVEARRDMLLFMAELMDFGQALDEVRFLVKEPAAVELMVEQLADTYKKLGRFAESSQAYRFLLNGQKSGAVNQQSFSWLVELIDNNLRERKFAILKDEFLSYDRRLTDLFSEKVILSLEPYQNYLSAMDKLTITIHREAKKAAESPAFEAVDALYQSLWTKPRQYFSFAFFYYGAQRLEELRKPILAMQWYQQAAQMEDQNQYDAAVSALRVARSFVDQFEDLNLIDQDSLKQIELISSWFIKTYRQKADRHVADLLYFQVLFLQQKEQQLFSSYRQLLKEDGLTAESYLKFSQILDGFYRSKIWDKAFFYAKETNATCGKCSYADELRRLMQESAFQAAFSQADINLSIPWYQTAIDLDYSTAISLKAWHNLFSLLIKLEDVSVIDARLVRFEEYLAKRKISRSELLVHDIRLQVAKFYYQQKLFVSAIEVELRAKTDYAIGYTSDDLLLTYFDYFHLLGEDARPKYQSMPQALVELAKSKYALFFWRLQLFYTPELVEFEKLLSLSANDFKYRSIFYDYLFHQKNQTAPWEKLSSKVNGKWEDFLRSDLALSFALRLRPFEQASYTQLDPLKLDKNISAESFTEMISRDLELIDQAKQSIFKNFKAPFLHWRWLSICHASNLYQELDDRFHHYLRFQQQSLADWKDMNSLLEARVSDYAQEKGKMATLCLEAMNQYHLYSWQIAGPSLWPRRSTLVPHQAFDQLLLKEIVEKNSLLADQVYELLKLDYPLLAEWLVERSSASADRQLAMAIIRYYYADAVSVHLALSAIAQTDAKSTEASLIAELLRVQSGDKLALEKLKSKKLSPLLKFTKDLLANE